MLGGMQALLIQELLFPSVHTIAPCAVQSATQYQREAALVRAVAHCIWQARPSLESPASFMMPADAVNVDPPPVWSTLVENLLPLV